MGEPTLITVSARSPSWMRYRRACSVSGMLISLRWSTILRLISSGTRWSNDRLPASRWKMGILRRFAGMMERQLLVSP